MRTALELFRGTQTSVNLCVSRPCQGVESAGRTGDTGGADAAGCGGIGTGEVRRLCAGGHLLAAGLLVGAKTSSGNGPYRSPDLISVSHDIAGSTNTGPVSPDPTAANTTAPLIG